MSTRPVTPLVRATAAQLGVDTSTLTGTGVGGRVTAADVRRVAGSRATLPRSSDARPPGGARGRAGSRAPVMDAAGVVTVGPGGTTSMRTATSWDMVHAWEGVGGLVAAVDPYSANPLLDHYRATMPESAAGRMSRTAEFGRPPTLFKAGDLPSMTASGIEPARLRNLPWQARHAAAAAAPAEVAQIFEECGSGDDEAVATAGVRYGEHRGNVDYEMRLHNWTMAAPTEFGVVMQG